MTRDDSIFDGLSDEDLKRISPYQMGSFSPRQKNLPFTLKEKISALPVVPSHGAVLFPRNKITIHFLGGFSDEEITQAEKGLFRVCVLPNVPKQETETISFGTEAILSIIQTQDGNLIALAKGMRRILITRKTEIRPGLKAIDGYIIEDKYEWTKAEEILAITKLKHDMQNHLRFSPYIWNDIPTLYMSEDHDVISWALAQQVPMAYEERLSLFCVFHPQTRIHLLRKALKRDTHLLQLSQTIQDDARHHFQEHNRNLFLKEQLRLIKKELGETDSPDPGEGDYEKFEKIFSKKKLSPEAKKTVQREMAKLKITHSSSPEYAQIWTYLNTVAELPWADKKKFKLKASLDHAKKILNERHYGIGKVKDRMIELIALMVHTQKSQGEILLLDGPPGIGKTSLAESIAMALGMPFVRVSLGGVRDEAEIRGHRRTYLGALPGKIIQAVRQAGQNPCLILLDEIDKVGKSHQGDTASALLEVLDPEQNKSFSDHFLGFPYDLSQIVFMATSNDASQIPLPLFDRMELLPMSGYSEEEKVQIAKRHLIPEIVDKFHLDDSFLNLSRQTLQSVIRSFTREAGVRSLKRQIESMGRKVIQDFKLADPIPEATIPTQQQLLAYLGRPKFLPEEDQDQLSPGVSIGLSYSSYGGDILFIESRLTHRSSEEKGSSPHSSILSLTGRLGKVMQESAQTAWSYLKSEGERLGLSQKLFSGHQIHLHVPDGATPKDGPSAGVAILCCLVSLLKEKPLDASFAMTGEITLRGLVLPVGGIKEKLLAAHRYGKKRIMIPKSNVRDLEDIDSYILNSFQIYPVRHMDDVLYITDLVDKPKDRDMADFQPEDFKKKPKPFQSNKSDDVSGMFMTFS